MQNLKNPFPKQTNPEPPLVKVKEGEIEYKV
jgi:hypothetical protein